MRMPKHQVWAEMARRKVRFHKNEKWDKIKLWGLFSWEDVSNLLKTGELITDMRKENRIIWVTPSLESWEKHIKPLIKKYSLSRLSHLAGW